MNYAIIILVALAAICLIWLIIKKNNKDRKEYQEELNKSEFSPEKDADHT